MNEFFRQVQTDLKRIWEQMSLNQRVLLGAVSVAALGLLAFLVIWAQTPTYGVLFSKLSDQDAGAIVAKLKEQNIPYQLDGASIKVPEGQVHEARLKLAGEGLPAGGTVGFQELFNGTNWSATDFERRLNYQRGLEGELSRTISTIEGVDSTRVHIVIPKESLFIDNQEETTASVVLTLDPGARLEISQVKTIQHLVAKAVPHLAQNQVLVTDTSGRDYSEEIAKLDPKNLLGTDLSQRQLDIKKKFEKDLARKIQAMLDVPLGPGNSTVSVNTNWDFSQTEENAELYKPSQGLAAGIPLSEKRLREEYNGNVGGANGGVPGTVSNVAPDYQGATERDGRYRKEESTINYNTDKTVTRRIKEPALLEDTTIAISFNPAEGLTGAALDRQANEIAQLAAAAAGIPVEQMRNKVVVTPIRFNTAAADAAREAAAAAERNAALLKWGTVIGALALAGLTFGLLYVSFRRRQRQQELEAAEEILPGLPEGDLGITLLGEEGLTSIVREDASPEQLRLEEMKRELAAYVKSQPKEAVKLVKTWMIEDE